jgi:hypothetical protein
VSGGQAATVVGDKHDAAALELDGAVEREHLGAARPVLGDEANRHGARVRPHAAILLDAQRPIAAGRYSTGSAVAEHAERGNDTAALRPSGTGSSVECGTDIPAPSSYE